MVAYYMTPSRKAAGLNISPVALFFFINTKHNTFNDCYNNELINFESFKYKRLS